jgi:3-hydroxyacyl-[acyl-carrier-protein] dehydratase
MMFRNNLYSIKHILAGDDSSTFSVTLELNPSHEIFLGHFPDNPILPGVCTLQILKELVADHTGHELMLSKASSIKYLTVINPVINNIISFNIRINRSGADDLACSAVINNESVVFCRLSGEFRILT